MKKTEICVTTEEPQPQLVPFGTLSAGALFMLEHANPQFGDAIWIKVSPGGAAEAYDIRDGYGGTFNDKEMVLPIKQLNVTVVPMKKIESFGDLVGETLKRVVNTDDELLIELEDGRMFKLYHGQECCESVQIEDIAGDLSDLVGPVVLADESSESGDTDSWGNSSTWTFYRFGTAKGTCVIRWLGSSNGYYSESVDFAEV